MFCTRLCRHPVFILLLTILFGRFASPHLVGQEIMIGVTADVARERQSTSLPVFLSSSPDCGLFETGWEILPTFGGQVSFLSRPDSRLGLTGRMTISPSVGRLTTPAPEPYTFSFDVGGDSNILAEAAHEYRLETKGISMRLDLLLDYAITDRVQLHFGPSFGYVLGITVNRTDYINDTIYRFGEGVREQPIAQDGILATQKLMIGGRAGLSYSLPISSSVLFIPELFVRAEFTPLFQQASRFAFGPGIGFTLLTQLAGAADRDTTVDDIAPIDTPTAPPLRASIALHGTDALGRSLPWARIRIYETMRRTLSTGTWQIERRNAPPTLLVEPDFASIHGIREWRVLFRYRGEIIGSSSSTDDAPPTSIDWKIVNGHESGVEDSLSVELIVVDSSGATAASTDEIPLKIERLRRIVDDRGDSILYTLYQSDDDSDESTTEENDHVLREAIREAQGGGSIHVARSEGGIPESSHEKIDEERLIREAGAIADRLHRLQRESGMGTVPVTTIAGAKDPSIYGGLPSTSIPEIEIIVVRRR